MNQEGMFDNRAISSMIRDEIQRFESVHPSIYIIYDLIEEIEDPGIQQQLRDHITGIEDSFVNSQEWTISRRVPEIRLGVLGTCNSGKTSIVHRYLTGMYMPEESPEGGRYKKEVILQGQSNLLLVRDEGGPPEEQFAYWVDAVIFVFSLENEISFNTIYSYYAKMRRYCDMEDIPIILVGSQDLISETNPRVICESRIRRLTADLKDCQYFEVCATYGFNVERIFEAACMQVLMKRTVDLMGPCSGRRSLTASKSFQLRQSQCSSSGKGCDSTSQASRPASASNNYVSQGHSPPFRESTPSSDVEFYPLPPQRPERRNRPPQLNKDREKNVLQMEEEQRVKLLSVTAEIARMSAPASSLSTQNFSTQQGHELVDTRDFSSPFSTPNLARKKISSSVQKSSSFSTSGLLRHGSQLSLQIDMRELPSARASSGLKEKFTKRLGDRIDSFFKEFQVPKDKDKAPLTPLLSRIPRHRSYSIQGRKDDDKKVKNEEPKGIGRDIPIKQGYLQKRSNKPLSKDWQKKYVTLLDDGRLTYHPNLHDYMNNSHGKEIKLIRTTVKIPGQRPKGSETSQTQAKQTNGMAVKLPPDQRHSGNCTDQNVDAVVIQNSGLKHEIDSLSLSSSIPINNNSTAVSMKAETPNVKKKQHRRMKSNSKSIDISSLDGDVGGYEFVIVSLDNRQWHFEASSPEEREEWVEAIQKQILSSLQLNPNTKTNATFLANKALALKIRSADGNSACADCGAPNPDWASLNLGALICIECSGSHRNLGTHLSRVRSLELDEWPEEYVDVMTSIGNTLANRVWEGNIGQQVKPLPTSSREEKERWIRRKYEKKEFLPSLPRQDFPTHLQLIDATARKDIFVTILTLAYASPDQVVEPHSRDARTALHIAAAVGSAVLIQLLLWYGANPDQLDQEGNSAAHYASVANYPNCVRLLQPQRHSKASTLPCT